MDTKKFTPALFASIALLQLTSLGIYAVLVATIVYSIVICILNDISMKKRNKQPDIDDQCDRRIPHRQICLADSLQNTIGYI